LTAGGGAGAGETGFRAALAAGSKASRQKKLTTIARPQGERNNQFTFEKLSAMYLMEHPLATRVTSIRKDYLVGVGQSRL